MPGKRKRKNASETSTKIDDKKNSRQEQIDTILTDFDIQVESRKVYMYEQEKTLANEIRSIFQREILGQTKKLRNMRLKEFYKQGGQINSLALKSLDNEIATLSENVCSILSKVQVKKDENSGNNTEKTTRMLRKVTKTRTSVRRITRSSRNTINNAEFTPSHSNTVVPFQPITPKFDTSLPTPAHSRKPRAGEVILSLAGSPLENIPEESDKENNMMVSLTNGMMLMSIPEETDVQKIDEPMRQSLLRVKSALDRLLQKSK